MRVNFSLDQIFERDPIEIVQLFRSQGLDPERPYRSVVSFSGVVIEQDVPMNRISVAENVWTEAEGL